MPPTAPNADPAEEPILPPTRSAPPNRSTSTDLVIVGAGIIGLATARCYLRRHPDQTIVVLEAESSGAQHQTGRNSGVLHSGVYYRPGSLKARMAIEGRTLMVEFCEQHGIAYDVCGKVIVATDIREQARLRALSLTAAENGVPTTLLNAEQLAEREPHCAGIEALWVPSTGITDYLAVCEAMATELHTGGAELRYNTTVLEINDRSSAHGDVRISTTQGDIKARRLVNCAGLRSDQVAAMADAAEGNRIVPFRGEYYDLTARARNLVKNLIYPVPDPSFPFLGVHLTRMIDGSVHAGPNAVLALHREGYDWGTISRSQVREHLTNRGLWRLAAKHWRTGAAEIWRSLNKAAFVKALARLVPDICADDLAAAPAGVRAQAMSSDGELLDDFTVTRLGNTLHVLNAPSPAATASLPIAEHVVDQIT